MAPEILQEAGHSFPVDWWALGVLTYEMIVGFPPFYTGSNNNLKMYELIKKKPVYFPDPEKHKIYMTDECKDFIGKLLIKDPGSRLGTKGGLDEIINHPWLKSLNMTDLMDKKLPAPFVPKLSDNIFDVSNFDKQFTSEEAVNSVLPTSAIKQIKKNQDSFRDFA